jgi:hypothetical protein
MSGPFTMIDAAYKDDKEKVIKNINSLRDYAERFMNPESSPLLKSSNNSNKD